MLVFFFGKLALAECLSPLSLQNWKSSKCKEIPFRSHLSDKDYLNSIKTLLSTRLLLSKPPDKSSHTFWHLNVEQMLNPTVLLDFDFFYFELNGKVWYHIRYLHTKVKGIEIFPANLGQRKRIGQRSVRNVWIKKLIEICGSQYFFPEGVKEEEEEEGWKWQRWRITVLDKNQEEMCE